MAVLVLATSPFVQQQLDALRAQAPHERIHTDASTAPPDEVEALLAFRLAPGVAARFPRLRFVACAGAGVDDLLASGDLPDIPVVRPVDPLQARRIAQYVTLMVLRLHRDLPRLEAQQRARTWERFSPQEEHGRHVGLLGFGSVGRATAAALAALGFEVTPWRRTQGRDAVSAAAAGLARVLAAAHVLVCTLPLTPSTRGLLDARALAQLPRGAYVIDVSRGGILDHAALQDAIACGHVAGAALDVYPHEPLGADSPLWSMPGVLCTPHIAGLPRPAVAAAQFLDNLRRARAGEPLVNVIDRVRGY